MDLDLVEADRDELVVTADESLDRLTGLIENLLDMSRLQAGTMAVQLQEVAVEEVVARALDDLGPLAGQVVVDLPTFTDEIDVLISELQAKPRSIQAVTAKLTVLDHQLEILERTLTPVQTWSAQFTAMQHSVVL